MEPFTESVPPGRYSVFEICLFDADLSAPERYAHSAETAELLGTSVEQERFASSAGFVLRISEASVAAWEPALRPGEDPRTLRDGHFYGFGVDGGQGCFTSAEALTDMDAAMEEDYEEWVEELCWSDGERRVGEQGLDLVVYHCYFGDGAYPTWIGRDSEGRITCFLTDMLTVSTGEK